MLSLIVAALSICGLTLPLTIQMVSKALLLLDWWQGRLRLIQGHSSQSRC